LGIEAENQKNHLSHRGLLLEKQNAFWRQLGARSRITELEKRVLAFTPWFLEAEQQKN
jgi:hypothetical protein